MNKVFYMKKVIIVLSLLISGTFCFGQGGLTKSDYRQADGWLLSVGVNALGSFGTRNPFKDLDKYSFKNPIAIAIERRWANFLSIEQDFSMNGFDAGMWIDNGVPNEDLTYITTNTSLKYYYSDDLLKWQWVDLYVGGGLGIFWLDETNTSANLNLGAMFWMSEKLGFRFQATGHWAFNANSRQYDNNHIQYFLQGVYQFD